MRRGPGQYSGRIVEEPEIMVGKPVIRGTRIPVALIVEHLAYHPDLNHLFAAYPHLTPNDVEAALLLARDAVETHYRNKVRRSRWAQLAAR